MFSFIRKKGSEPLQKLFQVSIHVGRGSNSEMPANLTGAYVPVFVGGVDHETAAQNAVAGILNQGYEFIGIADGKIYELDATKWDEFIREAWPDFTAHFPKKSFVLEKLQSEFFFAGPFASYELKGSGD